MNGRIKDIIINLRCGLLGHKWESTEHTLNCFGDSEDVDPMRRCSRCGVLTAWPTLGKMMARCARARSGQLLGAITKSNALYDALKTSGGKTSASGGRVITEPLNFEHNKKREEEK